MIVSERWAAEGENRAIQLFNDRIFDFEVAEKDE